MADFSSSSIELEKNTTQKDELAVEKAYVKKLEKQIAKLVADKGDMERQFCKEMKERVDFSIGLSKNIDEQVTRNLELVAKIGELEKRAAAECTFFRKRLAEKDEERDILAACNDRQKEQLEKKEQAADPWGRKFCPPAEEYH
jgi:hypothetical protein